MRDLDTPPRSSSATRSAVLWVSAGRVVPREERAGHVSRPRPSPRGLSADLDTAARSSRPTRSASGARLLVPRRLLDQRNPRWSSSAPRRRSRARVETSHGSAGTLTRSRHASSYLVGYSISGQGVLVGHSISGCEVPLVEPASASERRSRPRPSPHGLSPDLDTAARPSRPTRSTDTEVPPVEGRPVVPLVE